MSYNVFYHVFTKTLSLRSLVGNVWYLIGPLSIMSGEAKILRAILKFQISNATVYSCLTRLMSVYVYIIYCAIVTSHDIDKWGKKDQTCEHKNQVSCWKFCGTNAEYRKSSNRKLNASFNIWSFRHSLPSINLILAKTEAWKHIIREANERLRNIQVGDFLL